MTRNAQEVLGVPRKRFELIIPRTVSLNKIMVCILFKVLDKYKHTNYKCVSVFINFKTLVKISMGDKEEYLAFSRCLVN